MYMTSWCKYCQLARAFLSTQPNVIVTERNIEANKTYLSQMLARSGGRNATPVLDVQGRIIVGFNTAGLSRAIADARRR
ncbi:MAG: glutaredoxin domain-containing protein [Vicinamibacteria bacterium]